MNDELPELLKALDEHDPHDHPLPIRCRWFALCTNWATGLEPHPILGAVPICSRCAAKVRELG